MEFRCPCGHISKKKSRHNSYELLEVKSVCLHSPKFEMTTPTIKTMRPWATHSSVVFSNLSFVSLNLDQKRSSWIIGEQKITSQLSFLCWNANNDSLISSHFWNWIWFSLFHTILSTFSEHNNCSLQTNDFSPKLQSIWTVIAMPCCHDLSYTVCCKTSWKKRNLGSIRVFVHRFCIS